MSTKKAHTLNHWFNMVSEVYEKNGVEASAGQVAKHAGTSRNTAKKWLDELYAQGAIGTYEFTSRRQWRTTYYIKHSLS